MSQNSLAFGSCISHQELVRKLSENTVPWECFCHANKRGAILGQTGQAAVTRKQNTMAQIKQKFVSLLYNTP